MLEGVTRPFVCVGNFKMVKVIQQSSVASSRTEDGGAELTSVEVVDGINTGVCALSSLQLLAEVVVNYVLCLS